MIVTERLILRPWREADRDPFSAMARDAEVMEYLPADNRDQSDDAIDRMIEAQAEHGYCFWAMEHKAERRFMGFCGLLPPRAPFAEVEIGWRLERAAWGKGYAKEAAEACLSWAWRELGADSVIAVTVPDNRRSWGLMLGLGMVHHPAEDFDHPDLPAGDRLRRHVLYRIARPLLAAAE
jgi:RimJ/RimL family protein N-acetyltransferase